ncbi:hypothetical protein LTR37_002632 [Vermiconidia calcicola]|uniref:Uncharacterized protein n=1 Tax=Vermiconidia calcicola TaxID=1690605 RepID=A0ACC3NS90_9PEZI|nr:hypothetical protein LTR37_002632 [Vermiconidia calcicola]
MDQTTQPDTGGDGDLESFRLLDLPPELWIKIVKLAVALEDDEKCLILRGATKARIANHVAQPAISRVCKVIRLETIPHFYQSHRFCFDDNGNYTDLEVLLSRFKPWSQAIGSVSSSGPQRIYVFGTSSGTWRWLMCTGRKLARPFSVVESEEVLWDDAGAPLAWKHLLRFGNG